MGGGWSGENIMFPNGQYISRSTTLKWSLLSWVWLGMNICSLVNTNMWKHSKKAWYWGSDKCEQPFNWLSRVNENVIRRNLNKLHFCMMKVLWFSAGKEQSEIVYQCMLFVSFLQTHFWQWTTAARRHFLQQQIFGSNSGTSLHKNNLLQDICGFTKLFFPSAMHRDYIIRDSFGRNSFSIHTPHD